MHYGSDQSPEIVYAIDFLKNMNLRMKESLNYYNGLSIKGGFLR